MNKFSTEFALAMARIMDLQGHLDEVIYWMKHNLEPEDVFTKAQLLTWAYDNGLTESEDNE